jgi:hypothetical protein
MTDNVEHGMWHGFESVRSSCGDLTVELVPALGAKIASIVWRGEEWLLQPRKDVDWNQPRVEYERSELCGWDEMFPTIVGAELPDHGEAWSREWFPSPPSSLHFSLKCSTVPAYFRRALYLMPDQQLQLKYEVTNVSDMPLAFLWAAHPQFVVDDHDTITIEGADLESVTAASRLTLPAGRIRVDDIAAPGETGKWWNALGSAVHGLTLGRENARMQMSLSAPHMPQWGLWIDRGSIAERDIVSFQPALGWHDDLQCAVATETAVLVAGHATVKWTLRVQFHTPAT